MRKIISVILVALMLFSVVAISASAALCECGNHKVVGRDEYCNCCINCPNLNTSLLFGCATQVNGKIVPCCSACVGFSTGVKKCNCVCDCDFCRDINDGYDPDADSGVFDDFIQEDNTTSVFQGILRRLSDVFDRIFGILFGILGIKG